MAQKDNSGFALRLTVTIVLLYYVFHSLYLMLVPSALPPVYRPLVGASDDSSSESLKTGDSATSNAAQKPSLPSRPRTDCVVPLVENEYPQLAPILEEYCHLQHSILAKHTSNHQRFVVYEPIGETGLGNRISSLVSTYLFAILSKRALVVYWPEEARTMYHLNTGEEVYATTIDHFFKKPGFNWLPNITINTADKNAGGAEEWLTCTKLDEDEDLVVRVNSYEYFAPLLMLNPYHKEQLEEMFNGILTTGFFRPLAWNILRPVDHLQREIDEFIQQNPLFIGIQIRTYGFFTLTDESGLMLVDVSGCVKTMIDIRNVDISAKWFVFTDRPSMRDYMHQEYPTKVIYYDRPIDRATLSGLEGAIIDLFIATHAKALLISHGSTFGKVAYGLAGVPPFAIAFVGKCSWKDNADLCYWDGDIRGSGKPYSSRYKCVAESDAQLPWKERHDLNYLNGIRCSQF